jgi:thymidylate synthase (FAD)
MRNIEVAILNEAHDCPAGMMMFLAKLTQRGHNIHCMDDLMKLYNDSIGHHKTAVNVANLPHGTIKRFTPITVAIVGASRRFLAQARTHQVGFNYVSASLQYSDYSGKADFVVPYALMEADKEFFEKYGGASKMYSGMYLEQCSKAMGIYTALAEATDNDTAGYAAPQGLRNILIMQANHEAWMHFIRLRGCNRNTVETQYVTMRIWEELLKTEDGEEMFHYAGPDCMYGMCREGKMCCGKPLKKFVDEGRATSVPIPRLIIDAKWPLLKEDK